MKLFPINKQQVTIKILFFLSFAAFASWLSYFYVYLKEVPHLSSLEIGIIAGFQQFNNIFVVPAWGLMADKFGRKKMLLIAMGASTLLIPGFLLCHGFLSITLFMIALTLVYNPMISLLDTIALDYEEQSKGAASYGEMRLWASLGWGSSSLLTGLFINTSHLPYIFPIASTLFLLVWLLLFFVYKPLTTETHLISLKPGVIGDLLKSERKLMLFFLLVFAYSLFSAPIYLIINVYYHELGASNSIIGLAFAVQAMSELPFFFYGKRLVTRFGAKKVFLFTMIATSVRMFLYGINHNPELAVGIGIMHGISIGLFFVSMIAFVHNIVPAHMRSTGQSLIYSFYAGGVAFGNILTGVLDDFISIRITMLVFASAVFLLAMFVLWIGPKIKLG
ncbi:MAG: MFS transporter [Salinivirgaceae bacterium]